MSPNLEQPSESISSIETFGQLKQIIESDPKLAEAISDMEMMDSNINRNFFKSTDKAKFPKILEIVKAYAESLDRLKKAYPQRPDQWNDYNKLENVELGNRSKIRSQMVENL